MNNSNQTPSFTYLETQSLQILARRTLDESEPIAARLSCYEALNARAREAETAWGGYSNHARTTILAALALDLSAAGYVTLPGETEKQIISDFRDHIAPDPIPEPDPTPETRSFVPLEQCRIAPESKPEPDPTPETRSFVAVCRAARERLTRESTPEPVPARLNDILSTKEIIVILAAMKTAADCYEAESNRTPLADIRRDLISRAKVSRTIAGRIQSLAKA